MAVAEVSALADRAAGTLVIGIDLGDRSSTYCVRGRQTEGVLVEGTVETKPEAILDRFRALQAKRTVMETGTHARWMAQLLELMGHEVIVGNARKLKLVSENTQKSEYGGPAAVVEVGMRERGLAAPGIPAEARAHNDLLIVRAREALVEVRTGLIDHVRGVVKSNGCRLKTTYAEGFVEIAQAGLPEALRPALSGVLATLAELNEQIYAYERQIVI